MFLIDEKSYFKRLKMAFLRIRYKHTLFFNIFIKFNKINFSNKYFKKNDEYYTSKYTWELIVSFIPKDKILWECFYSSFCKSPEYLRKLGFEVISKDVNFYDNDLGEIIISNPPFSDLKKIMIRLNYLNKPFILIVPISKLCCKYMKPFKNKIQIIIPPKRINFIKCNENGEIIDEFAFEIRRESNPRSYLTRSSTLTTRPTV